MVIPRVQCSICSFRVTSTGRWNILPANKVHYHSFTVEKPGRRHFNQNTKFNSTSNKSCWYNLPLVWCGIILRKLQTMNTGHNARLWNGSLREWHCKIWKPSACSLRNSCLPLNHSLDKQHGFGCWVPAFCAVWLLLLLYRNVTAVLLLTSY